MASVHWGNAPKGVRSFVEHVTDVISHIMADNLVGIYLNGSLALGCFQPSSSDIDLLIITKEPIPPRVKQDIVKWMLQVSGTPHPVEASFIPLEYLVPWQFPTPYDLHFSELWRKPYEERLSGGAFDLGGPPETDIDLAAHVTIVRHRGVTLQGASIQQVFPSVPTDHYVSALLDDFQYVQAHLMDKPVYGILNACRIVAFLSAGMYCSKAEGGEWALKEMPNRYHTLIQAALTAYEASDSGAFNQHDAKDFVNYATRRIEDLLVSKSFRDASRGMI